MVRWVVRTANEIQNVVLIRARGEKKRWKN